jgi:6-phosphogluconolactonase (cycloisomerase 2 family)
MLELKTIMDLKGEDPRGFNLSKDGEYLGCALMDINEVQIFKIDKAEGIPEKMAYSIHVNSPSALIMTD